MYKTFDQFLERLTSEQLTQLIQELKEVNHSGNYDNLIKELEYYRLFIFTS